MAVLVALLLVLAYIGFLSVFPHTGPSRFAPIGAGRVDPGTIGCQSIPGDTCYWAEFASSLAGLTLSHLRFEVTGPWNSASVNGPDVPPLSLGTGASVSVLRSTASTAGVWNLTSSLWTSGSSWPVPTTSNVTVIVDTGLTNSSTLAYATFWVVLTPPYQGALGFPEFSAAANRTA